MAKRLAHLLLILLLLCGVLYVTGCPKCKPEYMPIITEDEENDSISNRRQSATVWIVEIDEGEGGERLDATGGGHGYTSGGATGPN